MSLSPTPQGKEDIEELNSWHSMGELKTQTTSITSHQISDWVMMGFPSPSHLLGLDSGVFCWWLLTSFFTEQTKAIPNLVTCWLNVDYSFWLIHLKLNVHVFNYQDVFSRKKNQHYRYEFCFIYFNFLMAILNEFVCLALSGPSATPGSLSFPPLIWIGCLAMEFHQKAFLYP
jgi:hypothetical protein